jgi:basic membrane protein A
VLVEYIGDDTTAFNDPVKGEQLSTKMYDQGAEIIYHASGASGAGLFNAAVEAQKWRHRRGLGPVPDGQSRAAAVDPHVDAEARRRRRCTTRSRRWATGRSAGARSSAWPRTGSTTRPRTRGADGDITEQLDKFKQQIIDGTIVVPDTPEGA